MRVYQRLKEYMDKNNITQIELSKMSGISTSTLSLILRGGRKFECDELEKIITALNVPPDTFIHFTKKAG